ncbi:peptidoglycan DD-metalloendopeptidase family protein [Candidatus Oscillochloris fontis]|uniref:peptidoglycan DD-metalloendopeptidase family protein n=1 Tax=Candidatus Oscillochloris fontis TaxID=2496868 RepID=UPI001EE81BD0|nr:peptidoglycan DD-metalloendopeptidase family protein [Candidatus Oscillochloris fontis]
MKITLLALVLAVALTACATPPPPPSPSPTLLPPTSLPTPSAIPTEAASLIPTPIPPTAIPIPRDALFDPQRLNYAHNFSTPEIQALLEERGSPLATVRIQVGERSQRFTDVLVGLSSLYSINPKLLLALMHYHAGLLNAGTNDNLAWAMGYQGDGGNRRGIYSQLRWAAREIRAAMREYTLRNPNDPPPPLVFADGTRQPVSADIAFSRYVLARVLAPTTNPGGLGSRLEGLLNTYARIFGDPREPPTDWPALAQPFMVQPMTTIFPVTSFFDHDAPFLRENGGIDTFWGRHETDIAFAYDGHTGWDYAMGPPDAILAAAAGNVTFAGNSDDGCPTPAKAVIIDHGNGYRTLYWHLHRISVEAGQQVAAGEQIGIAGDSGCANGAHLHFQVQYLGRDVDPYGWCGTNPDPWATQAAGQVSVWLWADAPSPCGPPAAGVVVVDDAGPGFSSSGDWLLNEVGYAGGSRYSASSFPGSNTQPWRSAALAPPLVAAWRPQLPSAGRYRVLAYIPYALNGLDESREQRYLIRHRDGESLATLNAEDARNWWADLGTYDFTPTKALVISGSLTGDLRRGVWIDAIAFVPVRP